MKNILRASLTAVLINLFIYSYPQTISEKRIVASRVQKQLYNDYNSIYKKYRFDESICDDINHVADINFGNEFKAIIPFDIPSDNKKLKLLHLRLFNYQRCYWNNILGLDSIIVWKSNKWDMLNHLEDPPNKVPPFSLDIHTMLSEFRSTCFNISNPLSDTITIKMQVKGSGYLSNPTFIKIHEVLWTGTIEEPQDENSIAEIGTPVASALSELEIKNNNYSFSIYPGMTKQIWLLFNPKESNIMLENNEIYEYRGYVKLYCPSNDWKYSIPLNLYIYPFIFPKRVSLKFGGYDYLIKDNYRAITPDNNDLILDYLKKYYINVAFGDYDILNTQGCFSRNGEQYDCDTSLFKKWQNKWSSAREYYFNLQVSTYKMGICHDGINTNYFDPDSKEFKMALKSYADFWSQYINPETCVFKFVDEPYTREEQNLVIKHSNANCL